MILAGILFFALPCFAQAEPAIPSRMHSTCPLLYLPLENETPYRPGPAQASMEKRDPRDIEFGARRPVETTGSGMAGTEPTELEVGKQKSPRSHGKKKDVWTWHHLSSGAARSRYVFKPYFR